ncbi:MAG: hypothetical protein M3540_07335 [Actinomycetota bacterium]|nr:hypothetical protein [Actinomycetota bacterium]
MTLAATWPRVQTLIRRELRASEKAINILALDQGLNAGKADLERAIRAEQRRAVRRALDAESWSEPVRLTLTNPMIAPLERLFQLGRREALEELRRLGYTDARRSYVADPKEPRPAIAHLVATVADRLFRLSSRIEEERVLLDIGGATQALAHALYNVPGARGIAADVVSSALTAGLSETFERNEDLVAGWEWTSVLDQGTCGPCEAGDGTVYDTWQAAMVDLPGGGPAVACLGGGRCRCRVAPLPS